MTYPQGTSARLIEVAAAEVGTIEEGDNLTKYGKFTKADGCRGAVHLSIGALIRLASNCRQWCQPPLALIG